MNSLIGLALEEEKKTWNNKILITGVVDLALYGINVKNIQTNRIYLPKFDGLFDLEQQFYTGFQYFFNNLVIGDPNSIELLFTPYYHCNDISLFSEIVFYKDFIIEKIPRKIVYNYFETYYYDNQESYYSIRNNNHLLTCTLWFKEFLHKFAEKRSFLECLQTNQKELLNAVYNGLYTKKETEQLQKENDAHIKKFIHIFDNWENDKKAVFNELNYLYYNIMNERIREWLN